MGAEEFYTECYGSSARKAFNRAVGDARDDYGTSGHSGTIAEKTSFVVIPFHDSEISEMEYAEVLMDKQDKRISDKWGPAGCIECKSDRDQKKFLFFGTASS